MALDQIRQQRIHISHPNTLKHAYEGLAYNDKLPAPLKQQYAERAQNFSLVSRTTDELQQRRALHGLQPSGHAPKDLPVGINTNPAKGGAGAAETDSEVLEVTSNALQNLTGNELNQYIADLTVRIGPERAARTIAAAWTEGLHVPQSDMDRYTISIQQKLDPLKDLHHSYKEYRRQLWNIRDTAMAQQQKEQENLALARSFEDHTPGDPLTREQMHYLADWSKKYNQAYRRALKKAAEINQDKQTTARNIIAGIHKDLVKRGDRGTPYRNVSDVDRQLARLQAGLPPDPDLLIFDSQLDSETINALSAYKIAAPQNVISEDQALALWVASGGDESDFTFTPPQFYDIRKLVGDINSGRQEEISREEFEKIFGAGSYKQTLNSTKGLKRLNNGQYVDLGWYNKLPTEEQKWLKEKGFEGYKENYYITDPISENQYRKSAIIDKWGEKTQYGHWTGDIDWKQLNYDMAATDAWAAIEKGAESTSDKEIKAIAKQYNMSAPATNAINDVFKEFQALPGDAKEIVKGKKFDGASGLKGLDKWIVSEQERAQAAKTRQELAGQALKPITKKDGSVDIKGLARMIHSGADDQALTKHLINAGYKGKDAAEMISEARGMKKYEYDPDSFADHLKASAYEEGTARGVAFDILPFISSARSIEKRGYGSGWTIANMIGDALIVVPAVRGVSLSVKSGNR